MSQNQQPPQPERSSVNPSSIVALVLSILGSCGWVTLFSLLLPYDEGNNHGAEPIFNLLAFGINSVLLLVGAAISGTLSFCGLLTGAVALGNAKDQVSYAALIVGALGLIGGVALIIWRFHIVFG